MAGARLPQRVIQVREQEVRGLLLSFAYFFCLLCSYYILRPVRDEMGIQGGVENLKWMFTGTFLAMLAAVPIFGWAAARFPRAKLLPVVYGFFIINLLIFFALLQSGIERAYVAQAFFIWVSVFNLFVVSVFWSFMADLFSNQQARRLFGFIAAGGTVGALTGPSLTAALAVPLGPVNLLLISGVFLTLAITCIFGLLRWVEDPRAQEPTRQGSEALGGGIWAGVTALLRSPYLLGISLYIVLYTALSTFLYFEQARIMAAEISSSSERTAVFALMDLAVNVLTLLAQLFVTGRIVQRLGVAAALAGVPALVAAGFVILAVLPTLAVLIAFQVLRRAAEYAVARPAREILFTVVSRESKYKAKNFIDTVIYRGGDAASGWLFAGLAALGLGLSGIAIAAVPIAAAWLVTGLLLGRKQEVLCRNERLSV
jgi:ATP:ADP antiporter, AAA family